ncbi:MAG: ABC transporter permease [Gemmatimonadetes bacterium]|jgi:ABC-type lipoprotein release transport system permease subunit|nr:ABC transporter permease [Gemmatimonadota bacterium]MBT7859291.1 ABC transporter permease [Gemmatimonadota bacterium]
MILRLAIRNLRRNRRRTLLAGLAIGIGLGALIFTEALMLGLEHNMIRTATDTWLGHGQIHRRQFRDTFAVDQTIVGAGQLLDQARADDRIAAATARTQCFAMLTSAANVAAVGAFGIDPPQERQVSRLASALREGTFLQESGILIGSRLAETLEVGIGDRLVLTAAQAHTGELSQEMLRVEGIFSFGSRALDDGMAFLPIEHARQMLGLEADEAHEIALRLADLTIAEDPSHPLWQEFSSVDNEALGWRQLMPELSAVLEMANVSMAFVLVILFGVVALSVINTLFMSLHERLFEFGVLRAIGTRPLRMATLVMCEAAGLALVSIIVGALIGLGVTSWVAHTGIDYGGVQYAGVTFNEQIYPILQWRQFVELPLWVFFFSLAAGLYPARYAARLKPAEAMRRSF